MRAAAAIAGIAVIGLVALCTECRGQSSRVSGQNSGWGSSQSLNQGLSNSGMSTSSGGGDIQSRADQAMSGSQLRRSVRGEGNFVGADRGDTANIMGFEDSSSQPSGNARSGSTSNSARNRQQYSTGSRTNANRNNAQRGGNASYRDARGGQTILEVQPTFTLGFEPMLIANVGVNLVTRLQQSKQLIFPVPVQLAFREGVATISGTVASEHDRVLAEQLIALEPGVRRVENRLTVAKPAAPPKPAAQ